MRAVRQLRTLTFCMRCASDLTMGPLEMHGPKQSMGE